MAVRATALAAAVSTSREQRFRSLDTLGFVGREQVEQPMAMDWASTTPRTGDTILLNLGAGDNQLTEHGIIDFFRMEAE